METPFKMLIVGMSGCGKTYFLLDLIERKYKRHFHNIVLICPTYTHNDTYVKWKHDSDPNYFVIPCEHHRVDTFLRAAAFAFEGENTLLIVDDAAATKDIKGRTSEIVKLAFSGRHYEISTVVLTQQLTSVSKPFRDNAEWIVCFYLPDLDDTNNIFRKFLGRLSKEHKDEIAELLQVHKYARLEINTRERESRVVLPLENIVVQYYSDGSRDARSYRRDDSTPTTKKGDSEEEDCCEECRTGSGECAGGGD